MASKHDKLLMPGEELSFAMRPHWRFIVFGVTIGIVAVAGLWFWSDLWNNWLGTNAKIPEVIGTVIVVVILARYTIRPIAQWLFTRYYFTSYRVMTRSGVVSRRAADIPLDKISNVYYEQGLLDRMLGCGSLIIDSSGGDGFTIDNVTGVERVTKDVHILVEGGMPPDRNQGPGRPPRSRNANPEAGNTVPNPVVQHQHPAQPAPPQSQPPTVPPSEVLPPVPPAV